METITNAATAVTSTVSGLIYGQPKEGETATNETGGKEPLSGAQGKGTANDPFDQGNAENPVNPTSTTNTATSGNTSYNDDDFLKLNPVVNKATTDAPSTTDATGSTATGITDKAGVSDQIWKPTDIDEVKPSGAPGAGPAAPDYKVATPDLSSKTSETTPTDAAKDTTTSTDDKKTAGVETAHSDTVKAQPTVGGPIQEVLDKGTGASKEHTIDESEAADPHSKMNDKTHRATTAQKTGESGDVETHPAETTTSHTSQSSKVAESSSPSEEKSEKKMDKLKDKLKNKLHIGSKDK
ncbi:hypothetical protein DE146DRAFT_729634 [Phaeosphaeria sp. MPI-PUGE-AT-0046c]|nr:hypothetical protein DE146DRAFT_729634 [Phaeosphaeria sp. MPI-PUGE-AT-0046c]